MHNITMTPALQRALKGSKAVLKHEKMGGIPKTGGSGANNLSESVEAEEKMIPDHLFEYKSQAEKSSASTIDEGYILALKEGRGKQYKEELLKRGNRPNPAQQAKEMFESIEPSVAKPNLIPATPVRQSVNENQDNKRQFLQEVVLNLRSGGALKEEIVKIVMEEVVTEQALLPIMEKHFRRMLKTFIQESRKG